MKVVNNSLPKELLPLLGKPAIHYAILEGIAAGLTNIIVVINAHKKILRRYFENENFRATLYPQTAPILTDAIKKCNFSFLYQKIPSGEVNAIRLAAPIIGNNSFAIIYPDDIHFPFGNALSILNHIFLQTGLDVIGLSQVDSQNAHTVGNTGRVTLIPLSKDLFEITHFHSKGSGTFKLRHDIELRTCGIMISKSHIFEGGYPFSSRSCMMWHGHPDFSWTSCRRS